MVDTLVWVTRQGHYVQGDIMLKTCVQKECILWKAGGGVFRSERALNAKVPPWEGEREARQQDPSIEGKVRPEKWGTDDVNARLGSGLNATVIAVTVTGGYAGE